MALAPSLDLVLRAVQLEHGAVNRQLIEGVQAFAAPGRIFSVTFLTALDDAFAEVALFVAVAQFERFVFAGAGAGGHRRAAHRAAGQDHVHFHRGVTARIEDLAGFNVRDEAHNSIAFLLESGAHDKNHPPLVKDGGWWVMFFGEALFGVNHHGIRGWRG